METVNDLPMATGMKTGLYDYHGTKIKVGDTVRLSLDDGEVREFEVRYGTVEREVKTHLHFESEYAKVAITGIIFSWKGHALFPCVDEISIPDNHRMEIVFNPIDKLQVFKDGCCWFVCHNLVELINWYHETIDNLTSVEDLHIFEPVDIYKETCMWDSKELTYAEVLGAISKDIKEPYVLTSTED